MSPTNSQTPTRRQPARRRQPKNTQRNVARPAAATRIVRLAHRTNHFFSPGLCSLPSQWFSRQFPARFGLLIVLLLCTGGCSRSHNTGEQDTGGSQPPAKADASSEGVSASDTVAATQNSATESFSQQMNAIATGKSPRLSLANEPLSPSQLQQLPQVASRLADLILDAGGVDDTGMATICRLTELEHLRIRGPGITDEGIKTLCNAELPRLRILNLPQAELSAEGLAHLQHLPQLSQLRLGGRQLDDAAVEQICILASLKSLHLISPTLTDASVDFLARAPKLASFYLDDCDFSDDAWKRLFAAKPHLHVHIDQQHHDRDPNRHEH